MTDTLRPKRAAARRLTTWRCAKAATVLAVLLAAVGCEDDPVQPQVRVDPPFPQVASNPVTINGVTDLGTLAGSAGHSVALGVNDFGHVVGMSTRLGNEGRYHPVAWRDGRLVDLAPSEHSGQARAINSLGQIVGYVIRVDPSNGAQSSHAVVWEPDGRMTELAPGTPGSIAYDINTAGEIVGGMYSPGVGWQAAAWARLPGSAEWATTLLDATSRMSEAFSINDGGQVVGWRLDAGTGAAYAAMWQNGATTAVGPLNFPGHSRALSINNTGKVLGFTHDQFGVQRAFVWHSGASTDLGLAAHPGAAVSYWALDINDAEQIVGYSQRLSDRIAYGFIWQDGSVAELPSLTGGMAGSNEGSDAFAISNTGLIVGDASADVTYWHAATWTLSVLPTPGGTPAGTDVVVTLTDAATGDPAPISLTFADVDGSGTTTVTSSTVGSTGSPPAPSGFKLGNPPTYYDIETDATLAPGSTITLCIDYSSVSYGNEGKLSLLHYNEASGKWEDVTTSLNTTTKSICGTTTGLSPFLVAEQNIAPVVLSISLPSAPVSVNTAAFLNAGFMDANPGDAHTASIDWGAAVTAGTVVEPSSSAVGTVLGSYTYTAPGVYIIGVSVTDAGKTGSRSSMLDIPSYIVVYDPSAGFVTGGGWIDSPAGACKLASCAADGSTVGRATFGFVSRYKQGATTPDGNTEFEFAAGGLRFKSTSYRWLVVSGARGQFKGEGTINGASGYRFLLTAIDGQVNGGGGTDKFRIKLWRINADGSDGDVVYDNHMDAPNDSDATTVLGGGSIVIHTK